MGREKKFGDDRSGIDGRGASEGRREWTDGMGQMMVVEREGILE